jgi:chromosome segregation protein
MYLQSLEIFGFKSFAAKTKLEFHPGVTAIVGPNGCGKSNVLDSIRWVLGEQSAKALRGGEMADVIFSGTDSRPALGMAEVSLTFADCEKELGVAYNELCITRRVFRDGQSEYLLNKVPCRLRDIHQMFMDTGIGRSAYSIMEQGKIDAILSSRPEERRAIFEEAAGITKFKSQKKEALRKLEATEANLLRAGDIIKEVKRQIGSLQRQAGKARRYQALLNDARVLDLHQSHRQHSQLTGQLTAVNENAERLRIDQEMRERAVTTQEQGVAEQRLELELMEERLTAARQNVNELRNRISQGENKLGFNDERRAEFATLVERYERDIASADEKLNVQQSQIESTDLELETIQQSLAEESQLLEEKQAAGGALTSERSEVEREHHEIFGRITRIEGRLSTLRNDIANSISGRDGAEARLSILSEELQKLSGQSESLTAQHAELAAQLQQAQREQEAHQAAATAAEQELRSLQSELAELDRALNLENRALAEKESKLDALKQLNAAGEGFSEGTQAVLKGLDNPQFYQPAVAGALAQFIEVESEWITAIEASLGANLQAVVMKDAMVAEAVIKTLAAKQFGRAALALRDFTSGAATMQNTALPEGALAWATDRVKCAPEVEALVQRLLGGVAMVADIETAFRLLPQHPGVRLWVTQSGEVLGADGIASGGKARDTGSSVLQRKTQIAALATEAHAIQIRVSDLTTRRTETAGAIEAAQARLHEAREETQTMQMQVSQLRGQTASVEKEAGEARKRTESIGWERESVEKRHSEALSRLGELEQEAFQSASEITDLQTQQSSYQAQLASLRESENELNLELNELRVRVATERQRYQSLQNQRQPMAARLAELREMIVQRQRDIDGYQAKSVALIEDSQNIEAGIAQARGRLGDAEQEVEMMIGERSQMVSAVDAMESSLRETRQLLSQCHEQRSQMEVKTSQLQMRIENLCEHVQRRYQFNIRDLIPDLPAVRAALAVQAKRQRTSEENPENGGEAATSEIPTAPVEAFVEPVASEVVEEIDWNRVEALVHEMTQRLDSMGPVNLDAIQEYDELEQRHGFLESQLSDLDNSKAELLDVIAKINTTTRKLFAETFEKVRVNFQEMFTELFGGGKANLVLLDESDPLESGIDIIAKPPGKQLQSITLLSGGEKTMTAVALLFSIYMVKPSPFCVLDEMDAPLDESNINRFIKILDRFVNQSQFVVITHNKRTIAKADMLYGVTMEEHGVSKLVGVKFSKREASHESNDIIGTSNPGASSVPSVAESFGKSGELHSERAEAS